VAFALLDKAYDPQVRRTPFLRPRQQDADSAARRVRPNRGNRTQRANHCGMRQRPAAVFTALDTRHQAILDDRDKDVSAPFTSEQRRHVNGYPDLGSIVGRCRGDVNGRRGAGGGGGDCRANSGLVAPDCFEHAVDESHTRTRSCCRSSKSRMATCSWRSGMA